MSTKLKVALAQIPVDDNSIENNYKTIETAIDYSVSEHADILLTPEGSLSGYHNRFDQKELEKYLTPIREKAANNHLGLALGTAFFDDGECYNQIRFYDVDGSFIGAHSKVLLCGTMSQKSEGEITFFKTTPLRVFQFKGITIGGLICNDMWANPSCTPMPDSHLTHQLANLGAKIVFHSVNGGRDTSKYSQYFCKNYHESNLIMRAAASKLWIVTVDNAFPVDKPVSSYGGIVGPDGDWKFKIPDTGIQFASFELEI